MLILIGNSPSSGSTLLADLFDAVPGFRCGPESRLFCYRELYDDYHEFQSKIGRRFAFGLPSLQNLRGSFSADQRVLDAYGLSKNEIIRYAKESSGASEFTGQLKKHYFESRKGVNSEVWVEKYPENIFVASEFLRVFPNAYFIQVLRESIYVYNSLRKNRNFPPALAIATWFLSTAAGYDLQNHPRIITINYFELVKNPYQLIGNVAGKITGKNYSADDIKQGYEQNNYRKNVEFRNKEWTASTYGVIKNANNVKITDQMLEEYHSFGEIEISAGFRNLFGLPAISINEICLTYGFEAPRIKFTNKIDFASKQKFFLKFLFDYLYGTAKVKNLSHYLNPIKA